MIKTKINPVMSYLRKEFPNRTREELRKALRIMIKQVKKKRREENV